MSPADYLERIKERLLTDPIVAGFQIRRERATVTDGHIRVRVAISDGSRLEFSEYMERTQQGGIKVIVYSYHWENEDGNLIRRWDNTPHFPDLSGAPHHIHDGQTGAARPGIPMDVFAVLDQIGQLLGQDS